jgi:hypothetical protein
MTADEPDWPDSLREGLVGRHGPPRACTRLAGLSRNRVWRVAFDGVDFIVKASPSGVEAAFYGSVAPVVFGPGGATPGFVAACGPVRGTGALTWIVLESIPHPLPRSRWSADPEVMAVLARLHGADPEPLEIELFAPGWSEERNERVLAFLPAGARARTGPRLAAMRLEAQPLFEPEGWISGDPNPRNWGLRDDGSLVLFDWERLGLGRPELDLAITLPGLGDPDGFARVARASGRDARRIAVAKAWSVVEFLDLAASGRLGDASAVPMLVQALPDWLDSLAETA